MTLNQAINPENLIVKLDSQILSAMNFCPEYYRLRHVENWRPLQKPKPLERGSIMHHMVGRYRVGKMRGEDRTDHAKLVKECILLGEQMASACEEIDVSVFHQEDAQVFKDYILRWQYDGWEILAVEQPFSKILYNDDEPVEYCNKTYSGFTIIYEGIVDAHIRDPKIGQAIVDTKSESRRSYPYILNDQFQGYEWSFNCPVIVDRVGFQKTLADNERFRRLEHQSGNFAIEEWRNDAIEMVKTALTWHEELEGGREELKRNRTSCDKWTRVTKTGRREGCDFQKVCCVPKESRPFKLQANFYKDQPWDPYTRDGMEGVEDGE